METLQQKQLAFLNDTVAFYNSGNRATAFNSKSCLYSATATSPGCAIGRHITPELAKELDESLTGTGMINDSVFDLMPDNLKELTQKFLQHVQGLHDEETFWNELGISDRGQQHVQNIKQLFQLN